MYSNNKLWKLVLLNFVNKSCLLIFHQEERNEKYPKEKERRWHQGNNS